MVSSIDKKREKLKSKSTSFKDALTKNIDDIKSTSADVSGFALIGGAVLLSGYLIYKLLSSTDEYDEIENDKMVIVHSPRQESFLMRSIKQSISTFLLAIAKQKLLNYLNNKNVETFEK